MLVMSRKPGECFVVDGAEGFERLLKVKVIDVNGKNVKLGIEVADASSVQMCETWRRMTEDSQPPALAHAV